MLAYVKFRLLDHGGLGSAALMDMLGSCPVLDDGVQCAARMADTSSRMSVTSGFVTLVTTLLVIIQIIPGFSPNLYFLRAEKTPPR